MALLDDPGNPLLNSWLLDGFDNQDIAFKTQGGTRQLLPGADNKWFDLKGNEQTPKMYFNTETQARADNIAKDIATDNVTKPLIDEKGGLFGPKALGNIGTAASLILPAAVAGVNLLNQKKGRMTGRYQTPQFKGTPVTALRKPGPVGSRRAQGSSLAERENSLAFLQAQSEARNQAHDMANHQSILRQKMANNQIFNRQEAMSTEIKNQQEREKFAAKRAEQERIESAGNKALGDFAYNMSSAINQSTMGNVQKAASKYHSLVMSGMDPIKAERLAYG